MLLFLSSFFTFFILFYFQFFQMSGRYPTVACFPVTNNRCLDCFLIFQNFLCFIFLCQISDQCKQLFILALLIDQFFISSDSLAYRIEFTFTQTFFFHIYELVLNSALFKKSFSFFAVEAFLGSEYLYVHPCSSLILLFLRYNITVLDSLAYLEYST